MKRNHLLYLLLCLTLVSILVLVHPVSAEGNPAPVVEVKAEILNCNLQQGWCSRMPQVQLTASASGTTIQGIQGRLNGAPFKNNGATMTLDLATGHNQITYWAVTSSGIESVRNSLDLSMEERNVLATAFTVLPAKSSTSGSGRTMSIAVLETASGSILDVNRGSTENKGQLLLSETLASLSSTATWVEVKETARAPSRLNSKLISYLFTVTVGRKKASTVTFGKTQGISLAYSMILENTPPQLNIQPQTEFSGRLAFAGVVADDLSGLKSLRKRINGEWQPLEWQDSTWKFTWDTEKERITSGDFTLQLLAEDVAGNTQTASLQFQVLNRTWPLITLWALLLALAFTAVVNPRRKAWREMTALLSKMTELGLVDYFKEEE